MVTRKYFGYTASILKGSNRLIASSQANWAGLPTGSFVMFDDDEDFHKVVDKESFFLIKDFEKIEDDQILIKENVGVKLSLNDRIKLTFKEYELSDVTINNSGSGFRVGDILSVKGGSCKKDLINDLTVPSDLKVTKVDKKGAIKEVQVNTKGLYLNSPDSIQIFGSAELELNFSASEKRAIEDRSIANILYSDDQTVLVLNQGLPPNLGNGKLSVEKWELILSNEYSKETKINATYKVLTEFTPHLNLPLLRSDLSKNEAVLNQALMTIDKEIKDLKDKLN